MHESKYGIRPCFHSLTDDSGSHRMPTRTSSPPTYRCCASAACAALTTRSRRLCFAFIPSIVFAAAAGELVALVGEEHVERRQRAITAGDVRLELDLVFGGQTRVRIELLL